MSSSCSPGEAWIREWAEGASRPDWHRRARQPASVVVPDNGQAAPAEALPDPDLDRDRAAEVEAARLLRRVSGHRAEGDAFLLEATLGTARACQAKVLDGLGWTGRELNITQTRTVASQTKRAAITEVQAACGLATGEATTLVALAMTELAQGAQDDPDERAGRVFGVVLGALERGETCWAQVRKFYDTATAPSRRLTTDQVLLVAHALFGTDPALAAVERFDPDGELMTGDPWHQHPFEGALAREVTACEGSDVAAERERRARAYANRRARVRVHENGTASLTIYGPAVSIVGAWARYDRTARTMRAQSAPQTLDQLICDAMLAVLVHGTLQIPDTATLDELPQDELDHLVAVLTGAPRIGLQVVVPADALGLGHPICATCATNLQDATGSTAGTLTDTDTDNADGTDAGDDDDAANTDADPFDRDSAPPSPRPRPERPGPEPPGPAPEPRNGPGADPDRPDQGQETALRRRGTGAENPGADRAGPSPALAGLPISWHDPEHRHGRAQVAEVLGNHPFFITPGHARELFYTPGTTLHRLLTDPADGRCRERTIATYKPDTDMRRQVRAADVYSRTPWTRLTGRTLEIDHVIPYGILPGGITSEPNLADLDKRTHKTKTLRLLTLHINSHRDLTFTTLLGQLTRSRVHDYRQYLHATHPEDLEERRDLANRATYAALAARPRSARRPGPDDWLTITHQGPDGQLRPGPPEHPETLRDLLNIPSDPPVAGDDPIETGDTGTPASDGDPA